MHTYDPLKLPDTIGNIAKKLPLEALDKFCWINCTWYKEIQYELRRRWKMQVLEYYKSEHEQELEMKEVERNYPNDYYMQGYLHYDIWKTYSRREQKTGGDRFAMECSTDKKKKW
jgi:hypothetical protein